MPNARPQGEVKSRWQGFVKGLRSLLGALPEHRHQDQYLRIKEAALVLAESQSMADEVEGAYQRALLSPNNEPLLLGADAVDIVVMELEAFPLAVQVHESEEKLGTAKPGAGKRLRSAGKTILGSVGDLFKLSDFGKGAIAVLTEALELWGAD
jgi:hypothetical protein